jgi:hypothetical protein
VEPQHIEGYCEGMWIVPGFLSSGYNCVSYELKASIPVKNLKCSLSAYYKEEGRGHGILNLLKLNRPNNNSRKEKRPCPKEIITGK